MGKDLEKFADWFDAHFKKAKAESTSAVPSR
jgi:hypothetical protein